jgi:hypothetical protein
MAQLIQQLLPLPCLWQTDSTSVCVDLCLDIYLAFSSLQRAELLEWGHSITGLDLFLQYLSLLPCTTLYITE